MSTDLPDQGIELKRRTPDEQLAYLEDQCLSFISANSELRRLARAAEETQPELEPADGADHG